VQGEANAIEPNKRMLSAMTPSIVTDSTGQVQLVLGTPGGPTIITNGDRGHSQTCWTTE